MLTDEQLTAIEQRCKTTRTLRTTITRRSNDEMIDHFTAAACDAIALLAEVQRLRAELEESRRPVATLWPGDAVEFITFSSDDQSEPYPSSAPTEDRSE